jgi:hypothetical protein
MVRVAVHNTGPPSPDDGRSLRLRRRRGVE